jgi:hypothetical protein
VVRDVKGADAAVPVTGGDGIDVHCVRHNMTGSSCSCGAPSVFHPCLARGCGSGAVAILGIHDVDNTDALVGLLRAVRAGDPFETFNLAIAFPPDAPTELPANVSASIVRLQV